MFGIYGEFERMRETKKIVKAAMVGFGIGIILMFFMNPLAALGIGSVITVIEIYLPNKKKVTTKWVKMYADRSPDVVIKEIIPEFASKEISGEMHDAIFRRVAELMRTRAERKDTFHLVTKITQNGEIRKFDIFKKKNGISSLSFGDVLKLLGG